MGGYLTKNLMAKLKEAMAISVKMTEPKVLSVNFRHPMILKPVLKIWGIS